MWNIDEFIITLMMFSKNIFINSLIEKYNYNNVFYDYIKYTYYSIFTLSTMFIFIKTKDIRNFADKNTYSMFYKIYHLLISIHCFYSYVYSICIIEKTYNHFVSFLIITTGGLIYYTKFFYNMKNKYINQHDIFHYFVYIGCLYSMIIDVYNETMNY